MIRALTALSPARPTRLDGAIFLISFATLSLELLLTRIFSVTLHYHLSFMVVSLAMLGLGGGALVVHVWPSLAREATSRTLAAVTVLFAATAVLAAGIAFRITVPLRMQGDDWLRIAFIYAASAIPFLAAGLAIAVILTGHAERTRRLYFFDLAGAALACLAFIPATGYLGAPGAVLATAGVAIVAALLLTEGLAGPWRAVALAAAWGLLLFTALNRWWGFYDVRVSQGERQPELLAVRWNSFSRVEVVGTKASLWTPRMPFSAGISSTLDRAFTVREAALRYDGGAATMITEFDGDAARLIHLAHDVTSAPHQLQARRRVLILGAGGGRDVLTALHFGTGSIDAVEINPLTIELMRGPLRDYTGALYVDYPGVRLVEGDARTFVRGTTDHYDLIQASLVDTWAASAAGALALTENSLYTVEAFDDYLRRLTPDGVISFSRWYGHPPLEVGNLLALAREAFRRIGIADCRAHVLVVRSDERETGVASLATALFKASPITGDERRRVADWAARMRFRIEYPPSGESGPDGARLEAALEPESEESHANLPRYLQPADDDRPFFFSVGPLLPWLLDVQGWRNPATAASRLPIGSRALLVALIFTGSSALLFCVLPWMRRRRGPGAIGLPRGRLALWGLYFACIGLGYIAVEIVLIQRFSLFLGFPAYSLSVVLFSMLLFSGAGSALIGRWSRRQALVWILLGVCTALVAASLVLPAATLAALGAARTTRIGVVVVLIAPLGLLMGMPFPTALRAAKEEAPELVSWGWAVNGGTSVFASTLTVALSISYGFATAFTLGIAAYAVALLVALELRRAPGGAP